MKLTPAQEKQLRLIFESDPEKTYWTDRFAPDGNIRNPTRQRLAAAGLIEWKHWAGNSFIIRITEAGIRYLNEH